MKEMQLGEVITYKDYGCGDETCYKLVFLGSTAGRGFYLDRDRGIWMLPLTTRIHVYPRDQRAWTEPVRVYLKEILDATISWYRDPANESLRDMDYLQFLELRDLGLDDWRAGVLQQLPYPRVVRRWFQVD